MNTERTARPPLRGLIGFNLLSGILLGIVGFYFGWWLGHQIHFTNYEYVADTGQNDIALFLAYLFFVVGFVGGIGFLKYPLARMTGREPSHHENEEGGTRRYFGLCTDHKVIGLQYLVGIGLFFFIGGVNAMLIRAELLRPSPQLFGAGNYLTIVSLHGAMMMGIMTSGILGPFANYFVPLMIGAKRMAFPRIESLTFWLLMAAGAILTSAVFFGGLPTGWTGYGPLNDQANMGMDSYIIFFILVGVSMTLLGLNLIATIVTMRAPGFDLGAAAHLLLGSYLDIRPDGARGSRAGGRPADGGARPDRADLVLPGALRRQPLPVREPVLVLRPSGGLRVSPARVRDHPRVILPVFARKPLWGYRLAVAGMLGVALLSFFVWQHHLFVSGIDSALRPFYMLSTEVISIPTGFIFLCGMATLWRATIRYTVPMLFCLAWFFNFFIGGISGVFLSDTPSDVSTHGSFFVMAHFHYTIMGGLIFTFFAAIYYWVPKMTGFRFNERLAKIHFWSMFIAFNSTFGPLFAAGLLGMPRRVSTYASSLQPLNIWVSVSAFVLGLSMLVFLANVLYSLVIARKPAEANPWDSKSLEWQVPTPVPVHNFDKVPVIDSEPYDYGTPPPPPRPAKAPAAAPG